MNADDRVIPAEWAAARTLPELGRLTATWLEGGLAAHPSYDRPDAETRTLVPILAELNRAGLVTLDSQPGRRVKFRGRLVEQRAAVHGFADFDLADEFRIFVGFPYDFEVMLVPPAAERTVDVGVVPVTRVGGQVVTTAGAPLDGDEIADLFAGCSEAALAALGGAWQVLIYDMRWGHSGGGLWRHLRARLRKRAARREWIEGLIRG